MTQILIIGSGAEALHDTHRYNTCKINDLDIIAFDLDAATNFAKNLALTNNSEMRMNVLSQDKVVFRFKHYVEFHGISFNIMECQIAWGGSVHRDILEEYSSYKPWCVASMEDLYWIRESHKYLKNSPHFQKTRVALGRLSKYKVLGQQPKWYKALEKYHYNYSHPALNVSKESFFKDDFYVYDHDSIHKAVAIESEPAYLAFLKQGAEVECSRELFENLVYTHRLRAVIEESLVLAIERSLVPHPGKLTLQQAYDKALEKVCTSITSGWFREFAYDNYQLCEYKVMSIVIERCYNNFKSALEAGDILPFKGLHK